ncbi:hypothetical protein DESUT3_13510 [Desulfuromonas versatilis]|uniref:Endonuclease/exonuclease/phosphatase domain-containing protein n=1 Tax=Desulfuromonas versatilis TaxID=2802975 RepID=A0ABM8HTD4_9BACT|nr:endonuclease/exonuclease/phosphatase family protein [Desulfuromonas versatilis]BCR04282.1 hypothetical protein DESUT3_13510 [Desulfuromonas versatilis]
MSEPGLLQLVSWNVHAWRGSDGREDLERSARVIQGLQADILGLQEVVNHQDDLAGAGELGRLAQRVGMELITGPTLVRSHGEYGNALLSRFPVQAVRHIDLSFPHREPRGALDIDLDIRGHRLRVVVTHLGLRPVERRFQVRRLIRALDVHPAETLAVMGDLNEWFIFGRPLRWLHRHFGRFQPSPATFPAVFPVFSLDRIFIDPPHALQQLRAIRTPATRKASDHLPLQALVRLGGPGGG